MCSPYAVTMDTANTAIRTFTNCAFYSAREALDFRSKNAGNSFRSMRITGRASADVRAIAQQHLERIDRKIAELNGLKLTMEHLVSACRGDTRPDLPNTG